MTFQSQSKKKINVLFIDVNSRAIANVVMSTYRPQNVTVWLDAKRASNGELQWSDGTNVTAGFNIWSESWGLSNQGGRGLYLL